MAYPDDLLSPAEHVVIHNHPHWKMLLVPVLVLIAVAGGGGYLAALASGSSWELTAWIAIGVIGLALVLWLTVAPLVRWRTTHFIMTTDRVMYRVGVFTRTGLDIPLTRINSVRFEHSLLDRVLGCGTLVIESASDEPLSFDDIPNVERVHSTLYREINDNPNDDFQPRTA
ncbi:PH domain-containing protein [Actinosynnema mirum]|uniref:Membrane-flanked domain protein n=1 Tax=Actinosynnema mirum (strain ATCC 29888 / DSM 43827 / JCM 3225 / NBRC 14064 / NCIMB 13271 / NRRL B-12336 / IMRU 3971 / 101) TaxID=446462 RepID=C6WKD8_ACTMD|nr:PH domain-containing protein [Actinosynnema mirum]ACU40189.1 membrane-flanked domain protein [Actinosynnema mirum DSM 43827]